MRGWQCGTIQGDLDQQVGSKCQRDIGPRHLDKGLVQGRAVALVEAKGLELALVLENRRAGFHLALG